MATATDAKGREQRHHDMSSGEEHYALTWIRDHRPEAFDKAAAYVEQIRRMDTEHIRKEAR